MRELVCECGKRFDSHQEAVSHAKRALHQMQGLYFAHRKEVEEYFHACGLCTHVSRRLDGGYVTVCIALNPIAKWVS